MGIIVDKRSFTTDSLYTHNNNNFFVLSVAIQIQSVQYDFMSHRFDVFHFNVDLDEDMIRCCVCLLYACSLHCYKEFLDLLLNIVRTLSGQFELFKFVE